MSQHLVIDCSYLMSCLLPDEDEAFERLDEYRLYVPSIFYIECSSVINNALKRKRIIESDANQYLEILRAIAIRVDNFSSTPESISVLNKIAREKKLTPYDACYFELATRLNATLATKDKELISACQNNNITLF